jgi:NhaA family Na+:H+ antiporter
MIVKTIRDFLKMEAASGLILMGAAVLAIIAANSPLAPYYDSLLQIPAVVQIGQLEIAKPLLLWINDGLMAVFFFLIALELKRELLEGELADPKKVYLPAFAAIGGMAVPAAIYSWFNWGDPVAMKGWAIPAATDIAFALGVVALLGNRVPATLKIFLLSLAILDDIGAIVIIAVFYTEGLSMTALISAAVILPILVFLNWRNVRSVPTYVTLGIVLWVLVLKSGVHATLAGVVLGFFIPLKEDESGFSPAKSLEHDLHGVVAFAIMPVFAFANAGVSLAGISLDSLLSPVPLGIALGLILGKQVGVFGFTWLAVKLGLGRLPEGMNWVAVYGLSALCGIGFTMSLFIGSLAFEQGGPDYVVMDRLGILAGTAVAGLWGYLVLRFGPTGRSVETRTGVD